MREMLITGWMRQWGGSASRTALGETTCVTLKGPTNLCCSFLAGPSWALLRKQLFFFRFTLLAYGSGSMVVMGKFIEAGPRIEMMS